jgi:hypothetical protein
MVSHGNRFSIMHLAHLRGDSHKTRQTGQQRRNCPTGQTAREFAAGIRSRGRSNRMPRWGRNLLVVARPPLVLSGPLMAGLVSRPSGGSIFDSHTVDEAAVIAILGAALLTLSAWGMSFRLRWSPTGVLLAHVFSRGQTSQQRGGSCGLLRSQCCRATGPSDTRSAATGSRAR